MGNKDAYGNREVHISVWARRKLQSDPQWFAGYIAGLEEAFQVLRSEPPHVSAARSLRSFIDDAVFGTDDT